MTNTFIIVNALAVLTGILGGAIVENKLSTRYRVKKLNEQTDQYLEWKKKWIARYPDKADCISDKVPEVIGEHIIEPEDYIDAGYSRWLYNRGLYDSVAARDMYIVTGGKTDNDQKYSAGTGHEDRRIAGNTC